MMASFPAKMNVPLVNSSTLNTCNITTPAPLNISNEFTYLNITGMFLTLQLRRLTQPYGSLLFRGGSEFFWRCNPS